MEDRNTTNDPGAPTPDQSPDHPVPRSRTTKVLLVVLVVGALVLGYEYRDSIFGGEAGLWFLLLACLGMHLFMHRGHGHGGGGS